MGSSPIVKLVLREMLFSGYVWLEGLEVIH